MTGPGGKHQAPIIESVARRAVEVQRDLARRGHHRVALPDLVIAAAAEKGVIAVLHHDRDSVTITSVTQQPVEWVVSAGSVD